MDMKMVCRLMAASALSVLLLTAGCKEPNPVVRLYEQSAQTAGQPAKWAGTQPPLKNGTDSAAYLMGYVFGGNVSNMREKGMLPGMENTQRKDLERGILIALEADSATVGVLNGIMLGLELRSNMDYITGGTNMKFNNALVYKGFYQGLNGTVPTALPVPLAEEELNRLLMSIVDGNKAENSKK